MDSFRPGRPSTPAALVFRARVYNRLPERLVGAVERRAARGAEADGFELLVTTDQNFATNRISVPAASPFWCSWWPIGRLYSLTEAAIATAGLSVKPGEHLEWLP